MLEMAKTKTAQHAIDPEKVHEFLATLFAEDVHARRVFSLATGVVGVMHAAAASIHAIGLGLAAATGREARHAIKQVDRMLSNRGVKVWDLFALWVRFVLGDRDEAVVALDWTDFDADGQSTIALHLITTHGRATPLMWLTEKESLEGRRNEYEDRLLERLREIVPLETKVTVLADRGFGDQKLYVGLGDMGFDYVIRFRECVNVRDSASGTTRPAGEWVASNGRAKMLRGAQVTKAKTAVPAVVCAKAKSMKEAWSAPHRDRPGASHAPRRRRGGRGTRPPHEGKHREAPDALALPAGLHVVPAPADAARRVASSAHAPLR